MNTIEFGERKNKFWKILISTRRSFKSFWLCFFKKNFLAAGVKLLSRSFWTSSRTFNIITVEEENRFPTRLTWLVHVLACCLLGGKPSHGPRKCGAIEHARKELFFGGDYKILYLISKVPKVVTIWCFELIYSWVIFVVDLRSIQQYYNVVSINNGATLMWIENIYVIFRSTISLCMLKTKNVVFECLCCKLSFVKK